MSKPKKPVFPTAAAEDAYTRLNSALKTMETFNNYLKQNHANGTNVYNLALDSPLMKNRDMECELKKLGIEFCTALQNIYNEFVNIKDHEYYKGKEGAEHE